MATESVKKTVELRGVGKQYPFTHIADRTSIKGPKEFWALRDVSLGVEGGSILGIIGRNGAGKTTLLNIVAGVIAPTRGSVAVNGRAIGLFNLGVGFQDELTGKENIFLNGTLMGATRKELESKIGQIIAFSELGDFITMPLGSYSQGMRLRLGFSIVAHLDFDILLLDEILAVGDVLFQNKCFEKLMDLRRQGKALLVSSQSLELIQRLCDKVALLDHGQLLFYGAPQEGIDKYHSLLNTEKFFVGPSRQNSLLIEHTKRWADDISCWGKKLGTKEVVIDSVRFINKFGLQCGRLRSGDSLKIKVDFTVRNDVKNLHFGIAFFRDDGVYCYGPNTEFDGHVIPLLKPGKGSFSFNCSRLLLAPGEYRVSVAIWDKDETIAFDYHHAYYTLRISGPSNATGALSNISSKTNLPLWAKKLPEPPLEVLLEKWGKRIEHAQITNDPIRLVDGSGKEKKVFVTGESMKIEARFNAAPTQGAYVWIGIYRDDQVYCQGVAMPIRKDNVQRVYFPQLFLLPGGYRVSLGLLSLPENRFLICDHGLSQFNIVSNKRDHGTVHLGHTWGWKTP